jgi:AbrB family looped-hinge helix DNA binding protein
MPQTTVSSKFQVVIPKEVRAAVGLRVGEILQVVGKEGVISLIPARPVAEFRGFLKGMKTSGLREKRDRV